MLVKDYKEKSMKVVTTKSGASFTIRKVSVGVLTELSSVYSGKKPQDQDLPKILRIIVPNCVVEPKIVLKDPQPNELALDELNADDTFDLLEEIVNFSGVMGPLPSPGSESPKE